MSSATTLWTARTNAPSVVFIWKSHQWMNQIWMVQNFFGGSDNDGGSRDFGYLHNRMYVTGTSLLKVEG